MKCPYCQISFHDSPQFVYIGQDIEGEWGLNRDLCPSCRRTILTLLNGTPIKDQRGQVVRFSGPRPCGLVKPKAASRAACPADVPAHFAEDYKEAATVLADSPKAAAALSRRCVQRILREVAQVKHSNLSNEIQDVLDRGTLPTHISEALDSIRVIGNFAAHPIKSQQSGEIISVEPGEAEWNLDVLEALFDYFFVQPALLKKKKDALNAKLAEAGKPQIK